MMNLYESCQVLVQLETHALDNRRARYINLRLAIDDRIFGAPLTAMSDVSAKLEIVTRQVEPFGGLGVIDQRCGPLAEQLPPP
jgi:hypothetical protein